MRITNKSNLPEALVKAVTNDSYNRGESDFTVTELLKPPRQVALQKANADLLEEAVESMMYRVYGQIAHGLLEKASDENNAIAEKRYYATFLGKRVSGQIDTLSLVNGILSDYKFSTVWKFKQNAPADPEFTAQLNMQLELLRQNGLDATALQIIGLIRDYRLSEAKNNPTSYPQAPVVVVPIEMWSRERTVEFIETRIRLHTEASFLLPDCTKEERWAKDDIHAVMKGKRAINGGLQTSEIEALKLMQANPGTRIEFRPAQNVRCNDYCSAAPFCVQYQKLMALEKAEEISDAI